nr:hypothetical protein [uncultured Bacteroides sp.]
MKSKRKSPVTPLELLGMFLPTGMLDYFDESFAPGFLAGILLGNDILFFKVNNNLTRAFLHIYKVKVI